MFFERDAEGLAGDSGFFPFEYRPGLYEASRFLRESNSPRFLLLGASLYGGEGLPEGHDTASECRHRSEPAPELPEGSYRFRLDGGDAVMLVTSGAPPCPVERGGRTPDGSSALETAASWLEHLWDDAIAIPEPRFVIHSDVTILPDGPSAVVKSRTYVEGAWHYDVKVGERVLSYEERCLAEFELDTDPEEWIARPASAAREIAATLTRAKLEENLTDTVYSFRASRTLFMPYQFRPVIKMLRTGSRRLLIADEVGMGKTIEAGLVWSEFEARGQADRVLVVCPSGLVDKWRTEMQDRFGFETEVLGRDGLDNLLDRFETDRFPRRYHAVCSLQRLRVWEHLERLADLSPHFDLIVVDEAHALRNTATKSFALGSLLSEWSDMLLLLSATPLNLGTDDLFNLLQLLEPGEFFDQHTLQVQLEPNAVLSAVYRGVADTRTSTAALLAQLQSIRSMAYGAALAGRRELSELDRLLRVDGLDVSDRAQIRRLCLELNTLSKVLTRTRRAEVEEQRAVREPLDIGVDLTKNERDLYDAVWHWQAERAEAEGMPVRFIGQMPLRLAGACLPVIRSRILDTTVSTVIAEGMFEDSFDEDTFDEDISKTGPWDDPPAGAVNAARALGDVDTKFDCFVEQLREIVEQGRRVLVFTFFRPVVDYLRRRLRDGFRVEVLHGAVPSQDRLRRIADFRDGRFDVMLATRVASEGLDFEFCSAVVNYDLPWNPMEVEQRIGRIDRFGQQSDKVYILNFATPGTIETDIIERLHRRIDVFTRSIGELEPILRESFSDIRKIALDFSLTTKERDRHLEDALLAVETKAALHREFDDSAEILSVLDHASLDGFESEILNAGHYVGQVELAHLIEDWASTSSGARCRWSEDGRWLFLRGDGELESDLRQVQAAGERSASEIDRLARDLRTGIEIQLCLHQETARSQGADLLSASHALVRAALRVKQAQTRYGSASLRSASVTPGHYLVLVGIATWSGLGPAAALWTAACDIAGQPVGDEVGAELLTALAEAELEAAVSESPLWGREHVGTCMGQLLMMQAREHRRREQDNAVQVEARRVSLHDSHERKVANLHKRIDTLRREGKHGAVRLLESQLRNQERRLQEAELDLQKRQGGSLSLEHVALCSLEVLR